MHAVSPAVGRQHVRERGAIAQSIQIDTVSDTRSVLLGVDENSPDDTRSDIHNVIDRPTSIGAVSYTHLTLPTKRIV